LSKRADIDVVIVNYNGNDYLDRCLTSLTLQENQPRSITVVDNASTDGSADLVASRYPGIRLLRQDANIGFAAANNCAFEALSDSEWVALLNPDTEVSTDWVGLLQSAIASHPLVDMFSCRLVDAGDTSLLDGTGDVYHVSGLGWRRDHGSSVGIRRSTSDRIFAPCAAAALYRMHKVREAGAFDERYFCYNEDTDLAFRMRLRGAECVHLDHCEVRHTGSGITGRDSDFTVYHGHRNLVWTFIKNMPNGMFWRFLPQHLLLTLITILMYTFRGRAGVILRAKRDAIRRLPEMWRSRRSQQVLLSATNAQNIGRVRSAMVSGVLTPYLFRRK